MPLFELECQRCGKVFEVRESVDRLREIRCPACGAGQVERLWSPFSSPGASGGGCGSSVPGFG
jgi:putative FmdB family regulatory protein